MLVKELIEKLKQFDGEKEVRTPQDALVEDVSCEVVGVEEIKGNIIIWSK